MNRLLRPSFLPRPGVGHSVASGVAPAMALACALAVCAGCTRKSKAHVASSTAEQKLHELASDSDTIRLALLSPEAYTLVEPNTKLDDPDTLALVKRTHENLVKGASAFPKPLEDLATLSKSLFDSLNIAARYGKKTETEEKGVFRHDAFEIQADVAKTFIVGERNSAALPFGLTRGTRVDVKRWYANATDAGKAPLFDLGDLPLNAEAAHRLRPGEYFGIPANTSLFLNVNGDFLQRAVSWHKEAALLPYFQNALQGSLSAAAEGHLIGQGLFHLHILKVDADRVRVKVTTHQSMEGGVGVSLKASADNHYAFLPGSALSKLKGIKTIQEIRKPQKLMDLAHNVKQGKDLLFPAVFAQISKLTPVGLPSSNGPRQALEGVSAGIDRLVEAADALGVTIDEINTHTTARFDELAAQLHFKSFEKVQQAVDQSIGLEAAVDLSADFAKGLRVVADYVVDLSSPEGRIAFDRMVSGRVVMQARDRVLAPWNLQKAALSDFSYVDELADLDATKPELKKRAERKAQIANSFARGNVGLTFRIKDWTRGFREKWNENDFTVGRQGADARFKLKTWEFENTLNFGNPDTEAKSSGMLFPAGADGKASGYGNYFYTWKRRFPQGYLLSMTETLRQTVNVLGPTAFLLGIPERYAGEVPGDTTIELSIVYLPGAVESFFDKATTEDQMWMAFGATLSGWYAGRDPLPHMTSAGAEAAIASVEGREQCARLGPTAWGQGYCDTFRQVFLPAWHAAAKGTIQEQHEFLQRWYDKGWLANKAGGDLLSRFFNELMFVKHKEAWIKDVVVRLDYENTDDDSETANPDFAFGEDPAGEVVEAINDSLD